MVLSKFVSLRGSELVGGAGRALLTFGSDHPPQALESPSVLLRMFPRARSRRTFAEV